MEAKQMKTEELITKAIHHIEAAKTILINVDSTGWDPEITKLKSLIEGLVHMSALDKHGDDMNELPEAD